MSKAFKRKFDASSGKEIEPNYGKDKKVSTGYLMSSYSKFIFMHCDLTGHKYLRFNRPWFQKAAKKRSSQC